MKSLTPTELYALAGIVPSGVTKWGEEVPSEASGVYVISIQQADRIKFLDPFEAVERKNWRSDQEIIYIGRATVLRRRLRQFERHRYGHPSPHRGGQAILLLDCDKTITWAEVNDFGLAEDRMIEAFRSHAGRMPFGNRMRSAKMKADATRFAADAAGIAPAGGVKKTISHPSPEQEA